MHADGVRLHECAACRQGGGRHAARGRLAGHGGPRPGRHDGSDCGSDGAPLGGGSARRLSRLPRWRPALWLVPHARRRRAQRRASRQGGQGRRRQARGRAARRRTGPRACRRRRRCDGPHRLDAAVVRAARRLPRAGPHGRAGLLAPRRGARSREGRLLRDRLGDGAWPRGRHADRAALCPHHRHRRGGGHIWASAGLARRARPLRQEGAKVCDAPRQPRADAARCAQGVLRRCGRAHLPLRHPHLWHGGG
mmetsp:Transcript_15871/g.33727  ORF Transcript_15871/g.33727 Transcript_15871/m.33727 type:complete len:251 (-) Transcript_15871:2114-2866(-)